MNTKFVSKFVLLSLIGVFLFFVPVQNSKVPVVLITDTIKALLGPALGLVVVISCTLLVLGLIGARVFHIKALEQYYSGDPRHQDGLFPGKCHPGMDGYTECRSALYPASGDRR